MDAIEMKSLSKQQLADKAGVSVNTLNRWCRPYQDELEKMGVTKNTRILPPIAVLFIAEKFCIDV